jgi:hypothetical protein
MTRKIVQITESATCPDCSGRGERMYGVTFCGIVNMTRRTCETCWGSGDAARPAYALKRVVIEAERRIRALRRGE